MIESETQHCYKRYTIITTMLYLHPVEPVETSWTFCILQPGPGLPRSAEIDRDYILGTWLHVASKLRVNFHFLLNDLGRFNPFRLLGNASLGRDWYDSSRMKHLRNNCSEPCFKALLCYLGRYTLSLDRPVSWFSCTREFNNHFQNRIFL